MKMEDFWEEFRFEEQTELVNAKLKQYIINNNKTDTKHFYLINLYNYDSQKIIKILNQLKHPYIFKYGCLWIGIPSVYMDKILNHNTIITLAKNLKKRKYSNDTKDSKTYSSDSESETYSDSDSDSE